LFEWGTQDEPEKPAKNANKFFKLFGDDLKNNVEVDTRKNDAIDKTIKSFIEIGHVRNIIVHSEFAAYENEWFKNKTTEDIYAIFENALPFIEYVRDKLSGQ
jgi:hypothetical protein